MFSTARERIADIMDTLNGTEVDELKFKLGYIQGMRDFLNIDFSEEK